MIIRNTFCNRISSHSGATTRPSFYSVRFHVCTCRSFTRRRGGRTPDVPVSCVCDCSIITTCTLKSFSISLKNLIYSKIKVILINSLDVILIFNKNFQRMCFRKWRRRSLQISRRIHY